MSGEICLEVCINWLLLNKYRDENDSISWHSDNEKELGERPSIYSYSLGCSRIFKLKRIDKAQFPDPFSNKGQVDLFDSSENETVSSFSINLPHNSLLIIRDLTQKKWLHAIDKVKKNTPK